jgi:hypothetical protein
MNTTCDGAVTQPPARTGARHRRRAPDIERARAGDERFFRSNPSRYHRIRAAAPDEFATTDPDATVALVRRARGTLQSACMPMQSKLKALPDNEVFLELLWNTIAAGARTIDAATHLTMLKMAGCESEVRFG